MTTDDLRKRAEQAAQQYAPTTSEAVPPTPSDYVSIGKEIGFIAGALWHASTQPAQEPAHVQVATRRSGKNTALADAIMERATAQGIRVEFVYPSPTREQIDRAVGRVVADASNHPVPHVVLGESVKPLRDKVTDAVLALLNGEEE